jgi:hypothetical protein
MPTKEELERLPLVTLAVLCKEISDRDDASFPVAAREETQTLWDEWFAVQVRNDHNYKTREADLKTRAIDFLWQICGEPAEALYNQVVYRGPDKS